MADVDEATEAAWLEWRRGGIGASEIAAVLGRNPWDSATSVWLRKRGQLPDPVPSEAMEIGHLLEEPTAELFHRRTGLYVIGAQTWCEHAQHPWARCTVDGFVVDNIYADRDHALGVFEGKTTAHLAGFHPLPEHVRAQVQWQLFVTGERNAWVGVLATGQGFRWEEVQRDDAAIEEMFQAGREFWASVQDGTPPPIRTYSPADADALAEAYADPEPKSVVDLGDEGAELVEALRAAKEAATVAAQRVTTVENALKAALGNTEGGTVDGRLAVTWKAHTRRMLDPAAVRDADPDLAERCTRTTTLRRFLLK